MLDTFDIDSETVLLAVNNVIKDHKSLLEADKTNFAAVNREKIYFLLKAAVTPVFMFQVPDDVDIQMLKCVLVARTSSNDEICKRYSARIDSASTKSALRHSVHGNAATVMLSTICMLASTL